MSIKEAWGLQCPECGNDDYLTVTMSVDLDLYPNGTDDSENGDTEWDDSSHCVCPKCHHWGTVGDFKA